MQFLTIYPKLSLAQADPIWENLSDRLHGFSVPIPICYKDVFVNSFFPPPGRLWNSQPKECFPLTFDLSGFQSQNSQTTFIYRFFQSRYPAGLDKSQMCICSILEIKNLTNCCTWLFFNKYAHEHTFSVSWVCEATSRN